MEEDLHLEVASRTDRGVHARANALVLESRLSGSSLLGALNSISSDIWMPRAVPVAPGFQVREARSRWYRYLEAPSPHPIARWRAAAACFQGPTTTRNFARGTPAGSTRTITSVTVRRCSRGLVIDVRAPSFVWGMVRKIVSALRATASGAMSLPTLRRGIAGTVPLNLPLAEAERLVLWEVRHDVRWAYRASLRGTRAAEVRSGRREEAELRAWMLDGLGPTATPGSSDRRKRPSG